MIMLLLTAPMCHAINVSASVFSSKNEQVDDKEVKALEDTAHSAHKAAPVDLEEKLKEAESLMIGLANHKKAYEKSHNPRQAARTQSRMNRLSLAIGTIKGTLAKLSKTSKSKHHVGLSASKLAALPTSTSSTASFSSLASSASLASLTTTQDAKSKIHAEFTSEMNGAKSKDRKAIAQKYLKEHPNDFEIKEGKVVPK